MVFEGVGTERFSGSAGLLSPPVPSAFVSAAFGGDTAMVGLVSDWVRGTLPKACDCGFGDVLVM